MICPKCQAKMVASDSADLPLYRCQGCEGYWIDTSVVEYLMQRSGLSAAVSPVATQARSSQGTVTDVKCPNCKPTLLDRHNHDGIEFEWCSDCRGLFLEPGELDALAQRQGISVTKSRAKRAAVTLGTWLVRLFNW
jgi:Zn-finger nucleic acid-binding protein